MIAYKIKVKGKKPVRIEARTLEAALIIAADIEYLTTYNDPKNLVIPDYIGCGEFIERYGLSISTD